MNVSLYQAAAAMNANSRWQELIADNLASSAIPGFKKQDLSFEAVRAGAATGNASPVMPRAVSATNFQPGEFKTTNLPTDLAIEGTGFFEVQLPNGSHAYTRDGEFHVSAQGQLVTKQGYTVLSDNGPIQLDPSNAAPLSVASTGEISQGANTVGRLKIVEFSETRLLQPASAGYFLATDPNLHAHDAAAPAVRQGVLEMANTSSVTEMASLMAAMRQFETNQRVLQMHDERMGKVISELGNPA
jgi:flagellar basal-body rod protein FlgF